MAPLRLRLTQSHACACRTNFTTRAFECLVERENRTYAGPRRQRRLFELRRNLSKEMQILDLSCRLLLSETGDAWGNAARPGKIGPTKVLDKPLVGSNHPVTEEISCLGAER